MGWLHTPAAGRSHDPAELWGHCRACILQMGVQVGTAGQASKERGVGIWGVENFREGDRV